MRNGSAIQIDCSHSGIFLPTQIDPTNLVLWLRADRGVTLSSASISTDTLTTWTAAGLTSRTDNGDGTMRMLADTSTGVHRVDRAPTNLQAGPAMLDCSLKYVNNQWTAVLLGAGQTAFIDVQNGVVGNLSAGVSAVKLSGNAGALQRWRVTGTYASGSATINLAQSNGVSSWTGAGTEAVDVGTGASGPVLYQDRVSAWADQSGVGNNATQATAASQMIYQELDGAGLWIPTGQGGSPRIGNSADAEKNLGLPVGFYSAFSGDGKPETVVCVFLKTATPAATTFGTVRLVGAVSRRDLLQINTTPAFLEIHVDDAAGAKSYTTNTTVSAARSSVSVVDTATTESLYQNGAADSLSPRDIDVGTETWTSATVNARSRVYYELIVYTSSLSLADLRRVENGARARWGIAPL